MVLAGASGLIGRALLELLLAPGRAERVAVLARRPLEPGRSDARMSVRTGELATLAAETRGVRDVYIALGTTIKVAGSQAAFRAVDFDLVVGVARGARSAGARRLAVVSALGANARSGIFYNRVKGEAEDALKTLGYESLVIAQPSLLIGDRTALGQPTRSGELFAARFFGPVMPWIPAGVRPIEATTVARAMLAALEQAKPGTRVLSSAQMQRFGR
ncbi:MAG: NAD(P)H-binding protein [Rhizobacter sp.]|nr:NAD(P)H-binding protein [Rhizobacter sp.]